MSAEENKAIVRKYRAAHNQNKLDALDAIVAPDLISHAALPGLPSAAWPEGKWPIRFFWALSLTCKPPPKT